MMRQHLILLMHLIDQLLQMNRILKQLLLLQRNVLGSDSRKGLIWIEKLVERLLVQVFHDRFLVGLVLHE